MQGWTSGIVESEYLIRRTTMHTFSCSPCQQRAIKTSMDIAQMQTQTQHTKLGWKARILEKFMLKNHQIDIGLMWLWLEIGRATRVLILNSSMDTD
jgi:hypothetical protein